MSEECTDQCVVITCHDPEHNDGISCGCGIECNPVYSNLNECADCRGCHQYHRMISMPPPLGVIQVSSGIRHQVSALDVVKSVPQVAGEGLITCHWGNCRATFSSPAELVGHVNLHHLYIPSMHTSMQIDNEQSPSTLSLLQTDGASTDPSNLSCQWQNCGKHPEPKSSHTSVHVFKDHLGLPADIVSAEGTTENKFLQGDGTREPPTSTESMGTDLDILSTPSLSPTLSSMTESVDPIPRISLHTPIQEPDDRTASSASESSPSHRCSTCEELTVHLSKVHVGSGRPIYECLWKGCSRNGEAGFGSRQKINRHLQSHTGHRPFQCNICHQNFSEAATLQQHMRRHTREKPYVCDHPDCGKAFAIAGALTIHKRTHNGQRPFKCPHCDRTFAESSNLSKHLRTHTGVKPYTCREVGCSKSFARPDQLSRHLLTHKRRARPPDNL
ncbi:hypothetical protein JOM56_007483 [Amanita muscaria]